MGKLIILSIIQSALLVAGQTFLKIILATSKFSWTWKAVKWYLTDLNFFLCGISFIAAAVLWFYILKNFDLSVAYPLTAISYIFAILVSMFVLHEDIPPIRYVGIALIMLGVILTVKK